MVQINHLEIAETVKHYKTLGSTNAKAAELLEGGLTPPFWVLADEQSLGRGRHGRAWVSLAGNLMASAAFAFPKTTKNLSSLSLVAGLAVMKSLQSVQTNKSPPLELTLKWPNDILSTGAKLGGILIEATQRKESDDQAVIIGIGLNIHTHPELEDRKTTSLRQEGHEITRDALFTQLKTSLKENITLWDKGRNLAPILKEWQQHAAPHGESMTVKIGNERIEGAYQGLTAEGALTLKLADNTIRTITGGELL